MKAIFKKLIPEAVLDARRNYINAKRQREFENLSPVAAFTKVYQEQLWGSAGDEPFCSGDGSQDSRVVSVYVEAVAGYLKTLNSKPDVVDLGCGDFAVGSRIRPLTRRYVACDVVPALIDRNRQKFSELDVEFCVLDIVADELPAGDVVFLRQVLQHLSNAQIDAVVRKVLRRYPALVLTEHLPLSPGFTPNVDKTVGPDTRLTKKSGVELTAAPFFLRSLEQRVLCEVRLDDSLIRTTLYCLSK